MKWITRQFVHVDRTACPWLIKKFVDPQAEFIFIPTDKIMEVAKKEKATPYDTLNVELGHHGEKCSFDSIVEKYGITDPAILELAKIVRAADTNKMETASEAAGLEAIMTGISIVAKNDYEAIEKAKIVYDVLYINCKLKIIKDKYKEELERMQGIQKRDFLKKMLVS